MPLIEYLGPSIPTIAVVTFISSTLKESLEKQIASLEKQTALNKEFLEKQIATNKETLDKQIALTKDSLDQQIARNKESLETQIALNKELCKEIIAAADARAMTLALQSESRIEKLISDLVKKQ